MNTERTDKEEIIFLAEKTRHYCNLLIAQSNNWGEAQPAAQRANNLDEAQPASQRRKNK
jgi:hypothetical protein